MPGKPGRPVTTGVGAQGKNRADLRRKLYDPSLGVQLSIAQFATELGYSNPGLGKIVKAAGVAAVGMEANAQLYRLRDVFKAIITSYGDDVETMSPAQRVQHYNAELKRQKLMQEARQLVPASEMRRGYQQLAQILLDGLTLLTDELERDLGPDVEMIEYLERKIKEVRERIAAKMMEVEA